MNMIFFHRASQQIKYSDLPEGAKIELEGRGESRFTLPSWVGRKARPIKEVQAERRLSRELAKLKREHGQTL